MKDARRIAPHSTFNIQHSTFLVFREGVRVADKPFVPTPIDQEVGIPPKVAAGAGDKLLLVRDLKKYFPVKRGVLARVVAQVKAVDGVTFAISNGETLGLVGDAGSVETSAGRSRP